MKISAIDTHEKYEQVKALGILSDADCKTIEARLAKMVNKPAKAVPEVDISVPFVKGRFGDRTFSAKTMEGKNGKFVSIRVPVNVSGMSGYTNADTLQKFIEGLIQVHEELVKAGYPFPTEG